MTISILILVSSAVLGFCMLGTTYRTSERMCAIAPVRSRAQRRIGIRAILAHIMSTLRNGGTTLQAFQDLTGYTYPTALLSLERVHHVCAVRKLPDESTSVTEQVAVEAYMAYALSEQIGCETSRCLQVVIDAYKRAQLLHDLREQALTTPQATARLLAALPLLTLVLGEAMGAHPLRFLCMTTLGRICLVAALFWYIAGLVWIRRLLAAVQEQDAIEGQVFAHTVQARLQHHRDYRSVHTRKLGFRLGAGSSARNRRALSVRV